MELVASLPLAVGAEALRCLNAFLEDNRIAQAWYGEDYKTFTTSRFLKMRFALVVDNVFVVTDEDCEELIAQALGVCHRWYEQRGGECCWLPLYRTLKVTSLNKSTVKKAETALSSLGTVSSLPAARLSMWGLVVMAYADGARATPVSTPEGGFKAVLHAQHFVLTIKRKSQTDQSVAHLEPRRNPLTTAKRLPDQAWKDLLVVGHTFGDDSSFKWLLDGNIDAVEGRPGQLFPATNNEQLSKYIIDAYHISILEDRLRRTIEKCRANVVKFEEVLSKRWYKVAQVEKDDLEKRVARLERKQDGIAKEEATDAKNEELDEKRRAEKEHVNDGINLARSIKNCLEGIKESIVYHIGRNIDDTRRPDALLTAEEHASDEFERFKELDCDTEKTDEAKRRFEVIVALVKVLSLPSQIDRELSTRDTGETVLLADPMI